MGYRPPPPPPMGNNPILPMGQTPIPRVPRPRPALSADEVEVWRLAYLSDLYALGKTTLEQHERYAEMVLRGEQPVNEHGLPFMPDPELMRVETGSELR